MLFLLITPRKWGCITRRQAYFIVFEANLVDLNLILRALIGDLIKRLVSVFFLYYEKDGVLMKLPLCFQEQLVTLQLVLGTSFTDLAAERCDAYLRDIEATSPLVKPAGVIRGFEAYHAIIVFV